MVISNKMAGRVTSIITTDKAVATAIGDVDDFTLKSITTNGSSSEPAVRTRAAGQKITVKVKKNAKGDIKVTKVTLSDKKLKINAGKSKKLKVTIEPKNATIKKMYWKTDKKSIASISKGKIKSVTVKADKNAGRKSTNIRVSVVTVKPKKITKKCKVTVPGVNVGGIAIGNAPKSMTVGQIVAFKITLSPYNVTSKTVECISTNKAVAKVDKTGKVTAIGPGTAKITVTATNGTTTKDDDKKATFTVTVNPKPDQSMTVSVTGYSGTYDKATHGITVSVTNPASGAVVKYGTEEGEYTQDVSPTYTDAGDYTVYYQVTKEGYTTVTGSAVVSIAKAAGSVTFKEATITKTVGDAAFTNPLTLVGDGEVTYTVENADLAKTVATVDKNGQVTIVGSGTATIKATVTDGKNYTYPEKGKTATYTLTVKAKPSGIGDPDDYEGGDDPFN